MGWQSAWELYQDEHIDADWDDFERDYWGDNSEEEDDEKCTYWDTEGEIYVLSPYGMERYAGADFDTIQEIGRAEWETDNVDEDDSEDEDEDDYVFDEDEEDEDYDIMHPNETREEFLEHENFD